MVKGNGSRTRALAGRERNGVEARFHRTDTSKGTATLASLQGGSGFSCFSNLKEDAGFVQFPATDLLRGDHRDGSWSFMATMEALGLGKEKTEEEGKRGEDRGAGEGR